MWFENPPAMDIGRFVVADCVSFEEAVALGGGGRLFVWGSGPDGCLGIGAGVEFAPLPRSATVWRAPRPSLALHAERS